MATQLFSVYPEAEACTARTGRIVCSFQILLSCRRPAVSRGHLEAGEGRRGIWGYRGCV
jgi:hypothetical protein